MHKPQLGRRRRLAWKAVSAGTGVASAAAGRALIGTVWKRLGGPKPPVNAADRRISWAQTLSWALTAAFGAGVAGVVGQRLAAAGWQHATGGPPPGIRPEH
jgi:hypothetical protein